MRAAHLSRSSAVCGGGGKAARACLLLVAYEGSSFCKSLASLYRAIMDGMFLVVGGHRVSACQVIPVVFSLYIYVTLDNTVRKPGKVLCIPDRFLWWQATQNVTGPFPWYIATVGCGGKEEIDNLAQLVLVPFIRSHWVVCVQTFWSSLTTLHVI